MVHDRIAQLCLHFPEQVGTSPSVLRGVYGRRPAAGRVEDSEGHYHALLVRLSFDRREQSRFQIEGHPTALNQTVHRIACILGSCRFVLFMGKVFHPRLRSNETCERSLSGFVDAQKLKIQQRPT